MTNTKTPPAKKTSNKVIETRTWRGSQSINYRQIMELGGYMVKIEIKRDSHQPQSSAVASVFHLESLEWKPVYSVPAMQMATKEGPIWGREDVTANMFSTDAGSLALGLHQILFTNLRNL